MHIQIDKRFALGADRHAWFISEKKTRRRNGQTVEEWPPILWYSSLEAAVNGLAQLLLRRSDAQAIGEVLVEAEKITATLRKALQPGYEVRRRVA